MDKAYDKLEAKIDQMGAETLKTMNDLIEHINKAFAANHEYHVTVSEYANKFHEHVVRRLEDIEKRLSKIESDMGIVRADVTRVSNWTKTVDKMYDLTRTHAYEIPKIDERVKKLEERDSV